jgi:methyl-accepting chemotaxis protein
MFKNMKIGTKTIAGFTVVCVIMLIISITAYFEMKKLDDSDTAMYEQNVVGLTKNGDLTPAATQKRTVVATSKPATC